LTLYVIVNGIEFAGRRDQSVRLAASHASDRASRLHQALSQRHRTARTQPRQSL